MAQPYPRATDNAFRRTGRSHRYLLPVRRHTAPWGPHRTGRGGDDGEVPGTMIRRLGLALDDDPLFADLIAATRAAASDLGIDVADIRTPDDESGADLVLVIGRPARHVALLSAPVSVPRVVWSGEPLASIGSGDVGRAAAGPGVGPGPTIGRAIRAPRREVGQAGRWLRRAPLAGPPARWRESVLAARLIRTNVSELAWAASVGARIVVTSHDRAAVLARYGLTADVVPFGYHEALAGPLTPPDIGVRSQPIMTLGAPSRHLRRGRLLAAIAADRTGPPVTVLAGLWGTERQSALRGSRVLLDVHRIPGTFIGIRLVLALAAGVAVVTEPMPDPRPFVAGVTHLEVPAERLLATARELVADEDRRRALVAAGQALLSERLRLTDALRTILDGPGAAGTSGPHR